MKKFKKTLILIFILCFFETIFYVFAYGLTILSNTEKPKISLDENVNFYTEIKWQGQEDEYEIISFESPSCNNLRIANSSSSSKVEGKGNKAFAVKKYTFSLKPVRAGMGYVKPITIKYKKKGEDKIKIFLTEKISIKIISGNRIWVLWMIIIGLIITALVAIIIYLKKKKGKLEKKEEEGKPEDIAIKELKEIEKIRTLSMAKEFYDKISSILKNYIESKYDIKTKNIQNDEIVNELKEKKIEEEMIEKVEKILSISDMVKLAKHKPNYDEMKNSYGLMEELIWGLGKEKREDEEE
ncbi:MAG: hypothetical protein QMD92_08460 [bacterium]|nr:hypothetical protein [bacterium]